MDDLLDKLAPPAEKRKRGRPRTRPAPPSLAETAVDDLVTPTKPTIRVELFRAPADMPKEIAELLNPYASRNAQKELMALISGNHLTVIVEMHRIATGQPKTETSPDGTWESVTYPSNADRIAAATWWGKYGMHALKQIEISGPEGGPIQMAQGPDLSRLNEEQFAQYQQLIGVMTAPTVDALPPPRAVLDVVTDAILADESTDE